MATLAPKACRHDIGVVVGDVDEIENDLQLLSPGASGTLFASRCGEEERALAVEQVRAVLAPPRGRDRVLGLEHLDRLERVHAVAGRVRGRARASRVRAELWLG
jgi:hypothetical protein